MVTKEINIMCFIMNTKVPILKFGKKVDDG